MDRDYDVFREPSLHSECDEQDGWNNSEGDAGAEAEGKEAYITGIYMNQTSNPLCNVDVSQFVRPAQTAEETKDSVDVKLPIAEEFNITQNRPSKTQTKLTVKVKRNQKTRKVPATSADNKPPNDAGTALCSESNVVIDTLKRRQKPPRDKGDELSVEEKKETEKLRRAGGPKTRTFPCDYCSEIFQRMHKRDEHIKEQHAEYYGKFICLQCNKRFESRHILYQHRLRAHEPTGEFVCPVCSAKFAKQSGLKRHVQIHSDNPKWVCSYCSRSSFLSKGDMERHIRNKHTGEKPYACKYDGCDRRFTSSGDRAKHYLHHTGEKRFQCPVCGLKMHTSGELKQHSWIHTGERPYICTVCGEGFRQSFRLKCHSRNLQMHTRIHTGEKPFQCATCGKAFSDKVYLKRHEAIHKEERSHVCPQCGKAFKHDSNMRRHVATAHEKKFPYQCHECGVGCQGKEEFRRHRAKHNGMRAFNCPVCNKGFYTQEDVNSHVKVVHNAVRSICSVCGTQFKDLRSHRAHLIKTHGVTEEAAKEEMEEAKKMKKEKEGQGVKFTGDSEKKQHASTKIWYTCNICQKDFSFFKTLPRHYVRVHKLTWDEARQISQEEKRAKEGSVHQIQDNRNSDKFEAVATEGVPAAAIISTFIPAVVTTLPTLEISPNAAASSLTSLLNNCSVYMQNTAVNVTPGNEMPSNSSDTRSYMEVTTLSVENNYAQSQPQVLDHIPDQMNA